MGKLFGGLAMGFVSLSFVAAIEIFTGHRAINQTLTIYQAVKIIFIALLTAAFVEKLKKWAFTASCASSWERIL